ncbi:MAG TPA: YidC/Oxa1 family membrane protein insertase [Ktedonobacterales bacterium]|nr:YidC/Oxa1 family membrane protein insertase [Ktedonobacterales bacterium]
MDIGSFFGQLFGPIGSLFHYVFFLPVFNVLMLIYHLIPNFAISIVLLTLLIRCALIPLTRAQLKSSKAMQEIQPQLKELQAKYRSDPQRLMAEQQALYKANGVNPVQGCLPLLIQLPFLYALYYSFFAVLDPHKTPAQQLSTINSNIYPFLPHLTTPPDLHFLWMNLALPDPYHILPVIAALLTFLQLRMAMPYRPKSQRGGQKDAVTQSTSMMQYIMPAFTLFIGLSFPSGLALYWCVTTLFSAVQQYFISGWGSLFVSTPWEEKYSKPPKNSSAMTVAPAIAGAGARGVVASSPPSATEGGFRGMLKQMRETFAAAQQTAAEQAANKASGANGAGGANGSNGTNGSGSSNGAAGATGATKSAPSSYTKNQKPRPPKSGVKLVKPSATNPRPEDEILRDASSSSNGKTVAPEDAIKRDALADGDGDEADA